MLNACAPLGLHHLALLTCFNILAMMGCAKAKWPRWLVPARSFRYEQEPAESARCSRVLDSALEAWLTNLQLEVLLGA